MQMAPMNMGGPGGPGGQGLPVEDWQEGPCPRRSVPRRCLTSMGDMGGWARTAVPLGTAEGGSLNS